MLGPFGVEDERSKDDDAEDEEEDEQRQFVGARLERVDEDLESWGVASQFEQPHDADDAEELEHVALPLQPAREEVEIEGERGDEVDDVDRGPDEDQLARAHGEPDEQFEAEPGVADALDVEEGDVSFGRALFQHRGSNDGGGRRRRWCGVVGERQGGDGGVGIDERLVGRKQRRRNVVGGWIGVEIERDVADDRDTEGSVGLEAETENRDDDEEDGNGRHDLEIIWKHCQEVSTNRDVKFKKNMLTLPRYVSTIQDVKLIILCQHCQEVLTNQDVKFKMLCQHCQEMSTNQAVSSVTFKITCQAMSPVKSIMPMTIKSP